MKLTEISRGVGEGGGGKPASRLFAWKENRKEKGEEALSCPSFLPCEESAHRLVGERQGDGGGEGESDERSSTGDSNLKHFCY